VSARRHLLGVVRPRELQHLHYSHERRRHGFNRLARRRQHFPRRSSRDLIRAGFSGQSDMDGGRKSRALLHRCIERCHPEFLPSLCILRIPGANEHHRQCGHESVLPCPFQFHQHQRFSHTIILKCASQFSVCVIRKLFRWIKRLEWRSYSWYCSRSYYWRCGPRRSIYDSTLVATAGSASGTEDRRTSVLPFLTRFLYIIHVSYPCAKVQLVRRTDCVSAFLMEATSGFSGLR